MSSNTDISFEDYTQDRFSELFPDYEQSSSTYSLKKDLRKRKRMKVE